MSRRLALFLSVLLSCTTTSFAAEKSPVSFMPYVGGYVFDGAQGLDRNSMVMGLRLGYAVDEDWGVEGLLERIPAEASPGGARVNLTRYGLDGYYNFPLSDKLIPFAAAGLSGLKSDDTTDAVVSYGGGLKYMLADNAAALRLDLRHLILIDSTPYSNLEYTVGLQIPFCGGKPLPTVTDSDKDGVVDSLDQCPTTPLGDKVDAKGCSLPVDSDKDGVVDSQDQCPNTPAGDKVDAKGCSLPLDSDKDGVVDGLDQCPNTPAGDKVDAKGCSLPPMADNDKDGVADSQDLCPNTKSGQSVDGNGCPPQSEEPYVVELKINFDSGKSAIAATYHNDLKRVGDFMKAYPATKMTVEGHTDSQGSDEVNLKLSQERSEQVRKYLIDNFGISGDRIKANGFGSSMPVADNATAAGRKLNRRIDAVFQTK